MGATCFWMKSVTIVTVYFNYNYSLELKVLIPFLLCQIGMQPISSEPNRYAKHFFFAKLACNTFLLCQIGMQHISVPNRHATPLWVETIWNKHIPFIDINLFPLSSRASRQMSRWTQLSAWVSQSSHGFLCIYVGRKNFIKKVKIWIL